MTYLIVLIALLNFSNEAQKLHAHSRVTPSIASKARHDASFNVRGKPCRQFLEQAEPLAGKCESARLQEGKIVTSPERCTAIVYVDGRLRAWQFWEVKNASVGYCTAVPRREVVSGIDAKFGKGWVLEIGR
jgi:hypothetical protein